MNDEEIAAKLIQKKVYGLAAPFLQVRETWQFVNHRDGTPVRTDAGPRIDIESDAFMAWFDGSEFVEPDGRPRIFWHGTFRDFTVFDENSEPRFQRKTAGFYFTSSFSYACRHGYNIYEVALRARHVRVTTNHDDISRLTPADKAFLRKGGYDAIAFDLMEAGVHRGLEVAVFDPDQIALISRRYIGDQAPAPMMVA